QLVLQVPAQTLLEGDTVTLHCWVMWDMSVTRVRFDQDKKDLGQPLIGTELSLSPLQLNHSGHYHCQGLVDSKDLSQQEQLGNGAPGRQELLNSSSLKPVPIQVWGPAMAQPQCTGMGIGQPCSGQPQLAART
ncbi:hypothetical protein HGM15179_022134, partial [Zosterops borbonicus]